MPKNTKKTPKRRVAKVQYESDDEELAFQNSDDESVNDDDDDDNEEDDDNDSDNNSDESDNDADMAEYEQSGGDSDEEDEEDEEEDGNDGEEEEDETEDDVKETENDENESDHDGEGDDEDNTPKTADKKCYMKNLNQEVIVLDEDDSVIYGKLEYTRVPNAERISGPIMTFYEFVRAIGVRAHQFDYGAEPLIAGVESLSSPKCAYLELLARMTPFIIRRHLPGKKFEDWRIDELEIIHAIDDDFFVPANFDWREYVAKTKNIHLESSKQVVKPSKTSSKKKKVTSRPARIKPIKR